MVYPENDKTTVLAEEKFDGNEYTIQTTGEYPMIKMHTKNRENPISIFSGQDVVKLDIDGKIYLVQVHRYSYAQGSLNDTGFIYHYSFNKKDDLVMGKHPGKAWTVDEMKDLAKKMIDAILKEERRLFTNAWK